MLAAIAVLVAASIAELGLPTVLIQEACYLCDSPPAIASPTPTVLVRDFTLEADLLRFLAEGKVTLDELTSA